MRSGDQDRQTHRQINRYKDSQRERQRRKESRISSLLLLCFVKSMPCITLFYLYYTYKKLNVCISYLDLSVAFTRSKSSFLLSFDSEHSCNQPIASLRNPLRSAPSPHPSSLARHTCSMIRICEIFVTLYLEQP